MIQKNDFIEIEYTAKSKDDDFIFDTTDEKVAKDNHIAEEHASYGSVVVCVGQGQVLSGLDKALVGKEEGKDYTITIAPEDAFGKKSAKLIQLIPMRKFAEQKVMPQPGLQIDIDGMTGIIRTVSGGRILVDFNHPLSSKTIEYQLKIKRKVENDVEKITGFLKLSLGLKDVKVNIAESKAEIELKMDLPKEIKDELSKKIIEVIPTVKEVSFKKVETEPKKETKKVAKEATPK